MKIVTEGATRIVFVFSKEVVKLPWINFLKLAKIYLKAKKEGIAEKKIKRFHKNKILAIFFFLFYIISSNRREYLYYKKHSNQEKLLPLKGFMFGYIIIQPRAEVLAEKNPRWKKLLLKLIRMGIDNTDLLKACNFCIYGNQIKLLDYGSSLTHNTLNTYGFEILNE